MNSIIKWLVEGCQNPTQSQAEQWRKAYLLALSTLEKNITRKIHWKQGPVDAVLPTGGKKALLP